MPTLRRVWGGRRSPLRKQQKYVCLVLPTEAEPQYPQVRRVECHRLQGNKQTCLNSISHTSYCSLLGVLIFQCFATILCV